QRSCAGLPGHLGAKQTDRAGAYYNYSVPRSNLALHGHGVIGDTTRLGQRGARKGKRVRYVVQAAGWHADVVSHRSMRPRAEPRTFGAQIVFPGAAIDALAADLRGGLRNDAVSPTKAFYPPPHSRNCAAKLMAEHDRHAHWPALRVVILMDVASADSDGAHTQQHLLFVDFRYGHLPQLDGKRREGV